MASGDRETVLGLSSKRERLQKKLKELQSQRTEIDRSIREVSSKLHSVEENLKRYEAKSGDISITEHAKARFAERVLGYNSEREIRLMIAEEGIADRLNVLGGGTYPVKNGKYRLVFQGFKLITVLMKDEDYDQGTAQARADH